MTTDLLAGLGVVAALAAVYWFVKLRGAGDDGPIRVKGGSVVIEAPQTWVGPTSHTYRLARNNPRLSKADVVVTLDGHPQPPSAVPGNVVQVDVVDPGDTNPSAARITIGVSGGVNVASPRLTMNGKELRGTDPGTYMTYVRVLGGNRPATFGPYTAAQSKLLVIEIDPK